MHLHDPSGKLGLGFLGGGYLLHVVHDLYIHSELTFWTSFGCTCVGGLYYLLKIYFDFIKKNKK